MTPGVGRAAALPRIHAAARAALAELGLRVVGDLHSLPTAWDRPLRQVVQARVVPALSGATALRPTEVAVKVLLEPTGAQIAAFAQEHDLPRVLGRIADDLVARGEISHNPVIRSLHARPIHLPGARAAVTDFVRSGGPLDAGTWGQAVGLLHRIGSAPAARRRLRAVTATNTLAGLRAPDLVAAFARPGHPFHGRTDLALHFARTLHERARRALELDPVPLLAHRDLHALNCLSTRSGPMVLDWQEAGWGSRSDDWAWLYLTVSRLGGSPRLLHEARAGYRAAGNEICPSDEQIAAAGHVRELICLGFSLQKAGCSPRHRREALNQLPVLRDPQAPTRRWRLLHNPAIASPGIVPGRRQEVRPA